MCDLAEQSRDFEGRVMNAVQGLKIVCACDLISRTELGCEGRVMNAVLGMKESVCD